MRSLTLVLSLLVAGTVGTRALAAEKMVAVVVARGTLPVRTPLRELMTLFEPREIPAQQAPPRHVGLWFFSEKNSGVLLRTMQSGQVLTEDDYGEAFAARVEGELPPHKRAVAVKASPDTAAGGFLLPGSRVDVVHVRKTTGGAEASYLFENIRVVAVGQVTSTAHRHAILDFSTVTLELTPEQALRLATATDSGNIRLLLRAFDVVQESRELERRSRPAYEQEPPPEPPADVEKPKKSKKR